MIKKVYFKDANDTLCEYLQMSECGMVKGFDMIHREYVEVKPCDVHFLTDEEIEFFKQNGCIPNERIIFCEYAYSDDGQLAWRNRAKRIYARFLGLTDTGTGAKIQLLEPDPSIGADTGAIEYVNLEYILGFYSDNAIPIPTFVNINGTRLWKKLDTRLGVVKYDNAVVENFDEEEND